MLLGVKDPFYNLGVKDPFYNLGATGVKLRPLLEGPP